MTTQHEKIADIRKKAEADIAKINKETALAF